MSLMVNCESCLELNDSKNDQCSYCGRPLEVLVDLTPKVSGSDSNAVSGCSSMSMISKSSYAVALKLACPQCTFDNEIQVAICAICSYSFDGPPKLLSASSAAGREQSNRTTNAASSSSSSSHCSKDGFRPSEMPQTCPRCQIILDEQSRASGECEVCGVELLPKANPRGHCFRCKKAGHWQNQCPLNMKKEGSLSEEREKVLAAIPSGSEFFSSSCATEGIIELMHNSLWSSGSSATYYLCSPLPHISQTTTSEGSKWSCGYRNIQMMCSSLMQCPEYRGRLFNGATEVPDIHGIQSWIEKAWAAGFDEKGSWELGGQLLGTDTWIGATECATLLRFFGLRAKVVDFVADHGSTDKNAAHRDACLRLSKWLRSYFRQGYGYQQQHNVNPCKEELMPPPHGRYLPPLYFQHDGHSRTVVGYDITPPSTKPQRLNCEAVPICKKPRLTMAPLSSKADSADPSFSVFIFDPSANGKGIKANLLDNSGRWKQQLKRGLHTLRMNEYQIVYVEEGIMSPEEQQRSKVLDSEVEVVYEL